jgi:hypothetical protein
VEDNDDEAEIADEAERRQDDEAESGLTTESESSDNCVDAHDAGNTEAA